MDAKGSYDQIRFIPTVPPSLVCSICRNVVREPRLCKDGEHCFCFSCISQHLNESQTCPVCRTDLTAETLVVLQACFKRVWRELQIKCDYVQRGCPDPVQLGDLEDHVGLCGFAPVTCEKCGMQLNRKDKDNHEKSFCQLGGAKCQECVNIKANQDEMKQELCQLTGRLAEMEMNANVVPAQLNEIMNEQDENVNELKRKHDQMEDKMKKLKRNLRKIQNKGKQNTIDFREMKQKFELFIEKFNRVADVPLSSTSNREIIIMGGKIDDVLYDSVSVFNPANGTYAKLPRMNSPRHSASSCVYKNEVIVAGGVDGKNGALDTIEILQINQDLSRWTISRGKLPCRLYNHVLKVYQEKLLVIGGINRDTKKESNEIHELALDEPYTATLLAIMPRPRVAYSAQIVNDKLFILGGMETSKDGNKGIILDSVLMYDFITNEFKTCPSLPTSACFMSTVTWGNKIIVVGGMDNNGEELNDVIMYDTETGRIENLPSLNHKRCGHSAVICDDVIFVLGGWNSEEGALNSVESLKINFSKNWKELPSMREKRQLLTAVVKP